MAIPMTDTYERRALFMVIWHGATTAEVKREFPEWWHCASRLQHGSAAETLWWANFGKTAFRMRRIGL